LEGGEFAGGGVRCCCFVSWERERRERDIPPGFLGLAPESTVLGNALLMSVENESMISRLVFCGGKF
jgi:hypothetical protein